MKFYSYFETLKKIRQEEELITYNLIVQRTLAGIFVVGKQKLLHTGRGSQCQARA
jgi:hypothetical protein